MSSIPTVRKFASDEWRLYRALRLAALEESPDAFGSTIAHERDRADADWASRLSRGATSSRALALVAEVDNEPSGLTWVSLEDDHDKVAHLYQMWVAPEKRGQGVGRALLDAAIVWARSVGARAVVLDVTIGNGEAARLYEAAGFVATGSEKPLRPGSEIRSRAMRLALESDARESSA
jgi:ribosomal protein S18 acetylase RimI-like enzyme